MKKTNTKKPLSLCTVTPRLLEDVQLPGVTGGDDLLPYCKNHIPKA